MRALALVLALLAVSGTAAAQEAALGAPGPPSIPPGDDVITAMAVTARAPYAGMLLDTDTSIRWTNRLSWYRNELTLTNRLHSREISAITSSHAAQMRIAEDSYRREIDGLRSDLRVQATEFASSASNPWYSSFSFGLVVGLVATVLVVGFVAWALSSSI